MNSMTGYGKGTAENQGAKITVELKSVNHRFLDLSLKLPKQFACTENTIRALLKESIVRGHVDVYVNYEDNRESAIKLQINKSVADKYVNLARALERDYNIKNDFTVTALMKSPDVLIEERSEADDGFLEQLVSQAASQAIFNLNEMRRREGELLTADIEEKIASIHVTVDNVARLAPSKVTDYSVKLEARIKEMLNGVEVDEARLVNEVAFYTDKVAVDEEISRLYTHLKHFGEILQENNAVGRKLDFIVQEMNREANTIGSKCSDIELTTCVLQIKTDIEKIREQIQNME